MQTVQLCKSPTVVVGVVAVLKISERNQALGVLLVEDLNNLRKEVPPRSLCVCVQGEEALPCKQQKKKVH